VTAQMDGDDRRASRLVQHVFVLDGRNSSCSGLAAKADQSEFFYFLAISRRDSRS